MVKCNDLNTRINFKLEGLSLFIIIADANVNLHIDLMIGIGNKR